MFARSVALLVSVTALAACGSSTTQGTTAPATASFDLAALNAYTVHAGEEPGFVASDAVDHATARSFVAGESSSGEADADIVRLNGAGFRGAAVETLSNSSGGQGSGLSAVIALRSPASARAELTYEVNNGISSESSGSTIKQFSAATPPGAQGFTASQPGQGGAGNLLFVEGSCLVIVGDSSGRSDLTTPVIDAAQRIYARTHASCP